MKSKLIWVNNVKGIGILVVIIGHISSPFSDFIYSWHMPLFFFISGFFLKVDLLLIDFLKKDFKRIMIPYFIFSILGITIEILKRFALNRENLNYLSETSGLFIWMDFDSLKNTYAFVLWFLPALFFSRFFSYLILNFISTRVLQILITFLLFYLSFIFDLVFSIDNAMNALFFVNLGYLYFNKLGISNQLYFLCIIILVPSIYFYFGFPNLDMSKKVYENVIINIIWAISITILIILIIKKMDKNNTMLEQWGSNTMILFIFHPYTNNIAHILVEKIGLGEWFLKIAISLILLHFLVIIKTKYEGRGLFKYV